MYHRGRRIFLPLCAFVDWSFQWLVCGGHLSLLHSRLRRAAVFPTDKSRRHGDLPAVASEKPACLYLLSYYFQFQTRDVKRLMLSGLCLREEIKNSPWFYFWQVHRSVHSQVVPGVLLSISILYGDTDPFVKVFPKGPCLGPVFFGKSSSCV